MKIHAFQVAAVGPTSLPDVLRHIGTLALRDRVRTISNSPMRLEDFRNNGHDWYLDFAMMRQDGPARMAENAPLADFVLNAGEGFGEETAAYYNGNTGFMTLQYNHRGPRFGRIRSYLFYLTRLQRGLDENNLADNEVDGFGLTPVIKREAADRLERMQIVKKLEVAVYVPGVLRRDPGVRQSLSGFLDAPLVGQSSRATFTLSAGRAKRGSLNKDTVMNIVRDLTGIRDAVRVLNIEGKDDEDAPRSFIDLLDVRLEHDIQVARGGGHRAPRTDRWTALKQAYDIWQGAQQLA